MPHAVAAVVLVEGPSDRVAVERLARRRGRDLEREGVEVVAMGGAHNLRRHLLDAQGRSPQVRVAGLCDAGEEGAFRRVLEQSGYAAGSDRAAMEALGFFVCVRDLEDELIRALGAHTVEALIATEGDLESFRTLQKQPAQRDRTTDAQLHRFMGSGSGRKIRYAATLVDALDLSAVPRPLARLLDYV